jgi:hypothetical protein
MKGMQSRDSHPVLLALRTPVIMNTAIMWDVMPCSLVGICCPHFRVKVRSMGESRSVI